MGISFHSRGNFNNSQKWLDKIIKHNPSDALETIGREGVERLKNNTPRETGETASSWNYEVTTNGNISEVVWKNHAHPGSQVNVAKLIELGHGTGTGGYVPPRPYIKDAMRPIWNSTDNIIKGLTK